MPHFKLLLDPAKYLGAVDFPKEREVTISRIVREALPTREKDEKQSAPMLYILGRDGKEHARPIKVPKSVLYGLSLLLTTDTDTWAGKKIRIFPAICTAFGELEECLRVRFQAEIDQKVRGWIRKRKAPASAYIVRELNQPASAPPTGAPAKPPQDQVDAPISRDEAMKAAIERGEA